MPVTEARQGCPICGVSVMQMSRYPDYICEECLGRAVDAEGLRVDFANQDLLGGLIGYKQDPASGKFVENLDLTQNPEFFIDGIRCRAAEAHFGGVVVRPAKNK
jgi:hypothetical protein